MLNIKFSHNYPKIWRQTTGTLIAVRILNAEEVQKNKDLLEYDTRYFVNEIDSGYYAIPKEGKLLQLIFIGEKEIPFCTLRRHTSEKEQYYRDKVSKIFNLVIG